MNEKKKKDMEKDDEDWILQLKEFFNEGNIPVYEDIDECVQAMLKTLRDDERSVHEMRCYCSACGKPNSYLLDSSAFWRDEHGIGHVEVNLPCEHCGKVM